MEEDNYGDLSKSSTIETKSLRFFQKSQPLLSRSLNINYFKFQTISKFSQKLGMKLCSLIKFRAQIGYQTVCYKHALCQSAKIHYSSNRIASNISAM